MKPPEHTQAGASVWENILLHYKTRNISYLYGKAQKNGVNSDLCYKGLIETELCSLPLPCLAPTPPDILGWRGRSCPSHWARQGKAGQWQCATPHGRQEGSRGVQASSCLLRRTGGGDSWMEMDFPPPAHPTAHTCMLPLLPLHFAASFSTLASLPPPLCLPCLHHSCLFSL